MKPTKLILFAFVTLFAVGACSAETTPVKSTSSGLKLGTVAASKGTAARFKITRWHVIEQRDTNTLVFDGSDSTGKVRFAASLRDNGKTITATSYATHGQLVVDKATGTVTENTLGYDYARITNAFLLDRATAGAGYALTTRGSTLVKKILSRKGAIKTAKQAAANAKAAAAKKRADNTSAILKQALDKLSKMTAGGGAAKPAAQQKAASAQKAATSAKAKADKAQKQADDANKNKDEDEETNKDKDKEEEDKEQKDLDEETKENAAEDKEAAEDDKAVADEDKATAEDETLTDEERAEADAEAAESEQDAAESQDAADESAEDAAGIGEAEQEGDAAGEPAEDLGEDTADGEELPEDDGGETLDDGFDGGGDGGGDEAAEATGSCKKTACSKSTKVCICTHY